VYLVLDEDAEQLKDLLVAGPVWVVDTPANRTRVVALWDEGLRETGWLTPITGLPDERLETRLSTIETLIEHAWATVCHMSQRWWWSELNSTRHSGVPFPVSAGRE
jgi:hypothetical protein